MENREEEEFAGRSVVITGAAGIGIVLVQRFLTHGARVFAVDRDQDALDRLEAEHAKSAKLSTVVLDVSDEARCRDFAARVRSEWKVADVLIKAAGYFPLTPFEELTYAQWREIIAINLDGPFQVTHNLLPLLKRSQAGRIIFFSSASIYAGMPEQCPHVAATARLIGFTRSLAKVVGEHGITVNAVTPGLTVTAPIKKLFPADALAQAAQSRALKRDEQAEDLVGEVYFLASEDAGLHHRTDHQRRWRRSSFTKAAANEGTTNSPMKTLVIGGAGLVGSAVVKELGKRGADVRVFARNKSAVTDADKDAVEVAEGDLLDPATVEKALDGVDKLYLLNAVAPDELTQGLIAYDLARKHRLQHVVYHSVFRAEHFLDVPHFASKVAIENALKAFDVPWTIIRPNYFFQNDAKLKAVIKGASMYPMPLGPTGISLVDVRDIAEAAAVALTGEGHHGKTYNVNGPDVLSGPGVAAIWSKVLGEEVRYQGHDMEAFEAQMRKQAPAWSAFDIRMMMQGYLERGFTAGADDLETLTDLIGHPPRRYEGFVRETAAKWEKDLP